MDNFEEENYQIDYPQLFELLFDSEKRLPISKIYQLSDMPLAAVELFLSRWPAVATERREVLARHMADIIEENFTLDFSGFARLFMGDPSEKIRLAGLDLLWDSTDVSFVDQIIGLMRHDTSTRVRASAAATLGHYVLMDQWGELREQVEDPIVAALLQQLDDPTTDPLVRRAALESVASSASPRVPELIKKAYDDFDEAINQGAVFAMGRSADPRWVPFVSQELESDDPEMRAEAARAAGNIGSGEFSEHLAEMARFDDDVEVQLAAIYALGQIGNDLASRTLSEMSDDPEYEDFYEAIDDALEELMILGQDFDLSLLDWQERATPDDDDTEADDADW